MLPALPRKAAPRAGWRPGRMASRAPTVTQEIDESLTLDPSESAKAAGLHYVTDDRPGIRRGRSGKSFRYAHPDGTPVRDEPTLRRIRSLVIPPAWTDVWITTDPRGHLQATGRD